MSKLLSCFKQKKKELNIRDRLFLCKRQSKIGEFELDGSRKGVVEYPQKGIDDLPAERRSIFFVHDEQNNNTNCAPTVVGKSQVSKLLVLNSLISNKAFDGLKASVINSIAEAMDLFVIKRKKKIISQAGNEATWFYVIEEGEVELFRGKKCIASLGKGDFFGTKSLYFGRHTKTAKSSTKNVHLWRIHQKVYKKIMNDYVKDDYEERISLLQKVSMFYGFSPEHLNKIGLSMELEQYSRNDIIVQKENDENKFYIVKEGTVLQKNGGDNISIQSEGKTLGIGEFFGGSTSQGRQVVNSLLFDNEYIAHSDNVVLMSMTKAEHKDILNDLSDMQKLNCIPFISKMNLSKEELESLVLSFREVSYAPNQNIFSKGSQVEQPCIYVICEGRVKFNDRAQDSKEVIIGKHGDYFGDRYMDLSILTHEYTATSLGNADEPTICHTLDLNTIIEVLGGKHRLVNLKDKKCFLRRTNGDYNKIISLDENTTLDDLEIKKLLGRGSFGRVFLVKDKSSGIMVAMKVQSKKFLLSRNAVKCSLREKEIMTTLCHPFLVSFQTAFQDETRLYIVTNIYTGGTLYNLIYRKNTISKRWLLNDAIKFYAANVLEAMNYLHQRQILHRDIKPENVMIDADGFCVLIDLGYAKIVKSFTNTICGTPFYMAPEVITHKGYGKSADIWSYGILVYELIHSKTPFEDGCYEQMSLFEKIIDGKFKFEKSFPSSTSACEDSDSNDEFFNSAENLVNKLLTKNQRTRIGASRNGVNQIRKHNFFKSFDFNSLMRQEIRVPFIPSPSRQHFMKNAPEIKMDKYILKSDFISDDKQFMFSEF